LLLTAYIWSRDGDLTFLKPQAVLYICCFNFILLSSVRKTDVFTEVLGLDAPALADVLKFQARYPQFHTHTPNVNPAALLNPCFDPTQKKKQRENGFRPSPWRSNLNETLLENPCQRETLT